MDPRLRLARRRLRDRRRGDALVEFVLLAPTLLLILFGILEVGRVVDAWLIVENAAREGARVGASSMDPNPASSAQQAALDYLNSGLSTRADVAGTSVPVPVVTSQDVQVSAEVDIRLYTPLFQAILPSPMPVRATATMRRE